MNDKQLEAKIRKDGVRVQQDLTTLANDSATRISRIGDDVSQTTGKAKDDLIAWAGDSVSQLSEGFSKVTNDVKDTAVATAATVKKEVGHGLSQYNKQVQKAAGKVPGGFADKATKYPWVAMSFALAFGFVLGALLKPAPHALDL